MHAFVYAKVQRPSLPPGPEQHAMQSLANQA